MAVVRGEGNVIIRRENVVDMLQKMSRMSFNGAVNCVKIQNFLFENVQAEDFEVYNAANDMMIAVTFVPAKDEQPRHVYLDVFLGSVNESMSEEEIASKRLSEVIVIPRSDLYVPTKYKGSIAWCEIIDNYNAENYLPFKRCWPRLADA